VRSLPRFFFLILLPLFACISSLRANAALEIQVIGGAASKIPVALVPFQSPAARPSPELTEIIGQDLLRSGQISLVEAVGGQQVYEPAQINYPAWRGKGAEAIVIGQVINLPGGRFEVRFRLMDAVKQTQIIGLSFNVGPAQWRAAAHKIADLIYEKLTGIPGVFSTRIAYVQKRGNLYELRVADADGQNWQTVVRSREPIISPAFSPDGQRMAYVSFEDKKPVVYLQSLRDGSRRTVAAFKGSNSAPAWSPDGSRLAVTLTRDAGSQIYLIKADGSGLTRLTRSVAIDTEPAWSPDGQWIYFTSDRGGSPQIYRVASSGGEVKRVTFEGAYNVSPDVSPDGKFLAYIQRNEGRFRVVLQELATGQVRVLTDSAHDESPSFAPNGQLLLYATLYGGRGVLGTVSLDGRTRARLSEGGTDAREPVWGP
jgi:TolB protein